MLTRLIQQHNSRYNKQILPRNAHWLCCIPQPRDAHSTHSQGFPALRATKKLTATSSVTQLMVVLDLLLLQELKPWDNNAMSPSRPWILHSQITSTEPKKQKLPTFTLPSLVKQTPKKSEQLKFFFFAIFHWPSLWQKKSCEPRGPNSRAFSNSGFELFSVQGGAAAMVQS